MAPTREMVNPEWDVEGHEVGVLVRFRVPGSTFGPVEAVLTLDDAERFSDDVAAAVAFERGS